MVGQHSSTFLMLFVVAEATSQVFVPLRLRVTVALNVLAPSIAFVQQLMPVLPCDITAKVHVTSTSTEKTYQPRVGSCEGCTQGSTYSSNDIVWPL